MLPTDVGIAQTSPGSYGKRSQHSVAEDRGIAFAAARKCDDAPRENFSFFLLIVCQVELAADFIKGNRHRFDSIRFEDFHPKKGPTFIGSLSQLGSAG